MSGERDRAPEPRPSKQFAFDSSYDFAFRPATYWPDLPTEETVLAKVKGTVRRDVARALLEEPDETASDGIGDFLLKPDIGKRGKDLSGSLHPANLGGEFLPGYGDGEVEIARIDLASVTGDVNQVRARRGDDGRIHYRVVDEYWDEGSSFSVSPATSHEPLALGELIELIDTSSRDDEVYDGGLVDSHREYLRSEDVSDQDPAEFAYFATVSSPFYPMLNAYYTERAEAWLLEVEAEREAEREEELDEWLGDYRWQLEELTRALKGSSDSDELPEDPRARAEVLLVEGLLRRAEANCDEIGESADDLRVMIAIKGGDTAEALRLAKLIAGSG